MSPIRVAAAQLNMVVGDLEGNVTRLLGAYRRAVALDADLVVFPELSVTGYPPEDLVLKEGFVHEAGAALTKFAAETGATAALVGTIAGTSGHDGAVGAVANAAVMCVGGSIIGRVDKKHLPNYSVFDEARYFEAAPADQVELFMVRGIAIGASICEDAWVDDGPLAALAGAGAQLIVNLNASPYHRGKLTERRDLLARRAIETGCPIVYCNLVGGQDELVFDGGSMVVGIDGRLIASAPQFVEDLLVVDVEPRAAPADIDGSSAIVRAETVAGPPQDRPGLPPTIAEPLTDSREVYGALVVGTRDYVRKNGFEQVVIGMSGGVDSSLVAVVAADALGPENVHGVLLPSRYSSDHSLTDAAQLCDNAGIEHRTIAIEPAHLALLEMLGPSFEGTGEGLAEENIQPRIRGTVLMALSNKFNWLVLTTGNKSEMSVGYATLYGDMAGGFAVIKDVPKLLVYELCRDRNERAGRDLIPENVLIKPPSAELRPDQIDTDSLPAYDVLDPVLEAYVEGDRTAGELIIDGIDEDLVRRISRMVDINEYKRRQAPPGPRITTKAFGKDRRLPITNHYRG